MYSGMIERDFQVTELGRRQLLANVARDRANRPLVVERHRTGTMGLPARRGPWAWVRTVGGRVARPGLSPASEIGEVARGTAR
jgi:hypothetical protein